MTALIKYLGSVGFTVVVSVTLIILLTISTSLEAMHGTPFAQKVFYQTRWFDFLIALMWVNIFCSTILRYPYKKSQTGFLVTHIGLLLLLAGALVSKATGVEGQLSVYEGQTSNVPRQQGQMISVRFPNQEELILPLSKEMIQFSLTKDRMDASKPFSPAKEHGAEVSSKAVLPEGELASLRIKQIIEHATWTTEVKNGGEGALLNHAVKVRITSKQMTQDSSVWLIEHEAGNPESHESIMGPLRLAVSREKKDSPARKPSLVVVDQSGAEIFSIDLEQKSLPKKIAIPKTKLTVKDLEYFPYASVVDNKIANVPEGNRPNPAAVYTLVDGKGVEERQIRFALFPDFESMHATEGKVKTDLKFRLEAGHGADMSAMFDGPQALFFFNDEGHWTYEMRVKGGVAKKGDLVAGQSFPSGWMDIEFQAEEILDRAVADYKIIPAENDQGAMALALEVPSEEGHGPYWVMEGNSVRVHYAQGDVEVSLVSQSFKLPFSVTLKDFRKIDYPGTSNAASFESDVIVQDEHNGVTMTKTISMNQPLVYQGFKVFQSSYMNHQEHGEGSVFTVAKNPGIPFIYLGSIIAFIGAIIQIFWTKEKDKQ